MDKVELSYIAGLFDGEGSFSIQVQIREYKDKESVRFNPRMTISLKDGGEAILPRLVEVFGGQIYEYYERGKMLRWNLSRREKLIKTTEQLLPHLKIKKEIAKRFLEALKLFPKRKNHLAGERSWDKETTLKVAKIALTLNPYRKSKRGLEYLDELKKIYLK